MLQGAQLTQNSRVTTVTDRGEIMQIEFRKQGITVPQVRVMGAETLFEKLAALANRLELLAGGIALAIISPQIAKRLFTLKNRCGSDSPRRQSIRSDVGTIPAFWQTHLHCTRGIALGLRP